MEVNDAQLEQPAEAVKSYEDGIVDAATVVSACGLLYAAYQIWFTVPKFRDIFMALRVDIPGPTRFVLWLAHNTGLSLVFVGLGLFALELVRRRRSRRLAIAVMVAAIVSGPLTMESIWLPLYKIQDQLRKK